jgi:hypothetical protein
MELENVRARHRVRKANDIKTKSVIEKERVRGEAGEQICPLRIQEKECFTPKREGGEERATAGLPGSWPELSWCPAQPYPLLSAAEGLCSPRWALGAGAGLATSPHLLPICIFPRWICIPRPSCQSTIHSKQNMAFHL